jgi:hypothetical protein
MNIPVKFQLKQTTNACSSEQLIKTRQKIQETLFSLSLAAAKDRNPVLPNGPLHTWANIGQVWAILT